MIIKKGVFGICFLNFKSVFGQKCLSTYCSRKRNLKKYIFGLAFWGGKKHYTCRMTKKGHGKKGEKKRRVKLFIKGSIVIFSLKSQKHLKSQDSLTFGDLLFKTCQKAILNSTYVIPKKNQ